MAGARSVPSVENSGLGCRTRRAPRPTPRWDSGVSTAAGNATSDGWVVLSTGSGAPDAASVEAAVSVTGPLSGAAAWRLRAAGVTAAARAATAAVGNTGKTGTGGSGGKKPSTQAISPSTRLVTAVLTPLTRMGPIRSIWPSIRKAKLYTSAWTIGWPVS